LMPKEKKKLPEKKFRPPSNQSKSFFGCACWSTKTSSSLKIPVRILDGHFAQQIVRA
jgi:hypothetical protein